MVLEVRKHWVASFWPGIRLIIGLLIFVSAWAFARPLFWIFFVVGLASRRRPCGGCSRSTGIGS